MVDDVVNQGIPERFEEFLNRLDASGILLGAVSETSSLQVPPELPSAYCVGDKEMAGNDVDEVESIDLAQPATSQ